jgi:prepilin-type N-terminal cleavage/methylation domain-containing protein
MRKVLLSLKDGRREAGVRSEQGGFTLIEILIVISIIALLSSFVLVAVSRGRESAHAAMAKMTVGSLNQGLENYLQDETILPGTELTKVDCYRNDFPLLYNAL